MLALELETCLSLGANTRSPILRYIYTLSCETFTGFGESTSFVSTTDFTFLYEMTEHIPLHLGYVVMQSILHQASNAHIRVLHISFYIIWMVLGMGRLWDTEHIHFMGEIIPLAIDTLNAIRMVHLQRMAREHCYILVKAIESTPEAK